jgi:hypothetical protein
MILQNLRINRIIIHQVYRLDPNGNKIKPLQSHEYTNFAKEAMETFKTRVTSALGEDSKAVLMEIVSQDPKDLPFLINKIVDQDDESFATSSYDIAMKLTDVQQSKNIPGGILVVFSGKYGSFGKNFLGIIKAEVHSGYEKEINSKTKEISLKFVEELLLTPGSRLYKTAGFFEREDYNKTSSNLNDKWSVLVSDYQISDVDGKAAAHYFYANFLGCGYPQTSARTTKQFYDTTKEFILNLNISQSYKSELINALTTYLKVETSSTASAVVFSRRYFDIDTQDKYTNYIEESGLPNIEFTKDIEHISNQLKFRKVSFKSNVKITAPSDVFKDLVTIESIDGEKNNKGDIPSWTKVIIKDTIVDQS